MSVLWRIGRGVKVGCKFCVYYFGQPLEQQGEAVRDGLTGGEMLFRPERDKVTAGPKSAYRFILVVREVIHFFPFCASVIVLTVGYGK